MSSARGSGDRADKLAVHSLFESLQGESLYAGLPCFFIRLAGCSLACSYCDTPNARTSSGRLMSIDEICEEVSRADTPLVEVTGGEPLEQPLSTELMIRLVEMGRTVLLETSGAVPIDDVPRDVHVVMDLKTPGSGMVRRNLDGNIDAMEGRRGELKIVVTGEEDFRWACDLIRSRSLDARHSVSISPCPGRVSFADAAKWILRSGLRLRLQVQLHKIVWPDTTEER